MPIESDFYHRGYPVRIKYRGFYAQQHTYHVFVQTNQGPHFLVATSIFDAKQKAVRLINEWTSGDWTHSVQSTTSHGDDIRSVGSIRRDKAS